MKKKENKSFKGGERRRSFFLLLLRCLVRKIESSVSHKMRNCIKSKTFIFFFLVHCHRFRFKADDDFYHSMCLFCLFFLLLLLLLPSIMLAHPYDGIRCKICQIGKQEKTCRNFGGGVRPFSSDPKKEKKKTQFTFKCYPLVYEMHLSNFQVRDILKHLFIYLHLCLALRRE